MQCFPLYSLILATGNRTINYLRYQKLKHCKVIQFLPQKQETIKIHFSLDIEGAEFLVLKTIPWDKVDIEVRTTHKT